jgi:peroxiredoxin (alkyl hydroperoxide reductase subunit C)
LGSIKYPLASDITKDVSRDYGVLIEDKGIALRGLFIIDPDGVLQYQVVHALNIGRSVDETLRVLEALKMGGLCGADWKPGQKTLQA